MPTNKKLIRILFFILTVSLCCTTVIAQKLYQPRTIPEEWTKSYQPFRIAGNLYYVGSYDLASFLIATPNGLILINTGIPGSDSLIRLNIEQLGFKFSDIKILLATHAHYDHVGAMAPIKKLTGAKMMIGDGDEKVLADGGNSDYSMGGKGAMFIPVKADRVLHDNDTVALGGTVIKVLHHPGHTMGASSFLVDVKDSAHNYRVLIANMPTIIVNKLSPMPRYPNIAKDYAYTLNAMKDLKLDLWVASHASQFDLEKKHPVGSAYNPEAFRDQKGYNDAINDLDEAYKKVMEEK